MTKIKLSTNDQVLTATVKPPVSSGSRNAVEIEVTFDSKWSGYTKTAIFYTSKDSTVHEKALSGGTTCKIPQEVLREACTLYIALRGVKSGGVIKTSARIAYDIIPGSPIIITSPPSDTVYQEILTLASSIENKYNLLSIGGKNLLPGSKDFSGTSIAKQYVTSEIYRDFPVLHYETSETSGSKDIVGWTSVVDVEPDTDYVLSFYAKGSGEIRQYFYMDCVASGVDSQGATTVAPDGSIGLELTSEWRKYWVKWRTLSTATGAKSVLVARCMCPFDLYICGVKFEKGSVPTDWTPSLEGLPLVSNTPTLITDANEYTTAGRYSLTVAGKITNLPLNEIGILSVEDCGRYKIQTYISQSNRMFTRSYIGTWLDWKEVTLTAVT